MNLTSNSYASNIAYLLSFQSPVAKIRFEQAKAEEAFAGIVNGQSQQTNVPDQADPNQPRILFQSEKKSIAISQLACQLKMNFQSSDIPLTDQLSIARKNVIEFWKKSLEFKVGSEYGMHGIIFDINFPSKDSTETINKFLYDQFIKTTPIGDVAAIQLTLGYKVENYFINLTVSTYETRKLIFQAPFSSEPVDIAKLPVSEAGVSIRIDINNRPEQSLLIDLATPNKIMDVLDNFISSKLPIISGLTFND